MIESLLHKEESSLIFSAKKVDLRSREACSTISCLLSEVNKYTTELSFGSSCNTLSQRAQMSTEICKRDSLLINALTFIPGERGRPVENCDRFSPNSIEFPKQVTSLITAKQKVQYDRQHCVTQLLSLLMFRFVAFHYNMKLMYCGVLFLRSFLCKAEKKNMFVSKNDWSK